jgi:ABC-2 type transport system ATP-binding protein
MIEVRNLTKYFGPVLAVYKINFEVARGTIVGFLGPNGAGKTTTMRILTTYLPATSGIARVAGHDVMEESMEVRKKIGYLPESVPLYPEMRVEEYLHYRAQLKGVERKDRTSRVEYCLDRGRLRQVRRRLLGTLSKGYRQRVGLADAMIHDPPILILDEPTTGLDPIQIRETLALIKELGRDHTVLLSTHILSEVETICDHVIIINAGHIGLSRKMSELDTDPTLVLEVRGPSDQVANAIKSTDGVVQVSAQPIEDGLTAFEIRTQNAQDLREAISQRITRNGWIIRRLDVRRKRLEDRYMEVMREQDPLKMRSPTPGSTAVQPGGSVTGARK